jgi:hypothetical protein
MVSVIDQTISIQCKVKYDLWGDDMTLDELPTSFLELVKLFSKLFFPNNFSICYIDTNYDLQPIDGAQTYRELISVINKSDMKEIRLLVNIFQEASTEKPRKSKVNRKSSIRTNCSTRDSIFEIRELSEHSSNISEEAYSSVEKTGDLCSRSFCMGENGKNKKEKKATSHSTSHANRDVRTHSCISCY